MLGLLALMAAQLLSGAQPASAHAFQVQTRPVQGARLHAPPSGVVLQFSEPVEPGSAEASVRLASGRAVPTGEPSLESGGRVLRVPLVQPPRGIHVVAWSVVATVDGHVTSGEFAFSAGAGGASLPAAGESIPPPSLSAVAAGWLLFAGLALSAGGLTVGGFLGDAATATIGLRRVVRTGLVAALGGALAQWLAAERPAASQALVEGEAGLTHAQVAMGLTVALVAVAMIAFAVSDRPAIPLTALAGAGAAWALRSHAAAVAGGWAAAVDFVHLAAAGTWVGSLAAVTVILWQARRAGRDAARALVASYARLAVLLVAVTALTGVVSASQLLTGLPDLVRTSYGQILSVKVSLVVAAVGVALVGRFRGLPSRRFAVLRRVTTTEVTVLAVVLVAAAVLVNLGPPAAATAGKTLLGPPPIEGPVARAAGLAGNLTVGIAAGDGRLRIDVFGPSGPVEDTELELSARLPDGTEATLLPRPCGPGCFSQRLRLPDGATRLVVVIDAPGWDGGRYTGTLHWPPPQEDPRLLRQVIRRMRRVPRLVLVEQVTSGPGTEADSATTLTGARYVRLSPWRAGDAVDVRPLPGRRRGLSFTLPGSRLWFALVLDDHGRIVHERVVSPGHEIERKIRYPASP